MQQLIERGGLHTQNRFLTRDQAFVGHVDCDFQRGLCGALAVARLQHPQLAALDGEFEILHVAVMRLQQVRDAREFLVDLGERGFHRGFVRLRRDPRDFRDVLRRANARHNVLALRVDQELAVELLRAGRGIARESDAGRRCVAHIAEHHRLHVDGGAPARGNVVEAAVGDRALVHPGGEDRADRAPQLLARVLRKRLAGLAIDDLLVFADHVAPVVGRHVGVERIALGVLVELERVLEIMMIDVEHDVRIHLDEAAIGIEGEALVAGALRQRADGGVVEAEVQHRIHHAGHGGACARAYGNEQRIGLTAEFPAGQDADVSERRIDCSRQFRWVGLLMRVKNRCRLPW